MGSKIPRIAGYGIVVALTLVVGISVLAKISANAKKSVVRVTLSNATTVITEPLHKDGYPNYVAALDQRYRQGVTPENNAAVPFWQAVGPGEINENCRADYFRMLGISPLPEKGDYFVNVDDFLAQRTDATKPASWDQTWGQVHRLMARPWSKEEFPQFAEWLTANEKPLALVVEASKRPRRYEPLVGQGRTVLIAVLFPALGPSHDVARALVARAMLRLNEGNVAEAWDDLLACHRLARLTGQGPTMIQISFAGALSESACTGSQSLLQHVRLTAAQLQQMRDDLNRLPPLPTMADKVDVGERFTYLDAVVNSCCRGWPASMAGFDRIAEEKDITDLEYLDEMKRLSPTIESLVRHSTTTPIDWDYILRRGNSWFDRIAAACRKPTWAERRESLRKIDEELRRLKETVPDLASLNRAMRDNPRQAPAERLSEILLVMFLPQVTVLDELETRKTMRFELNKLAFALAAYRAELGFYPAKLADLVPQYVAEVPQDPFNGQELHYRRQDDGFVLYSVGINGKDDKARSYCDVGRLRALPNDLLNGKDDKARSYCDRPENTDWDDLVVRIPAPPRENEKP